MTTEYITLKDTAKEIRQKLNQAFPETKFSVRMRRPSAIEIEYTNGAAADKVEQLTHLYECASFDPSQDLKTYVTKTVNGKEISYASDYVFIRREVTRDHREQVKAEIEKDLMIEIDLDQHGYVNAVYHNGKLQGWDYLRTINRHYEHTLAIRDFYGEPK